MACLSKLSVPVAGCALLVLAGADSTQASPWAEVGDAQLRSDIDVLVAAGVIDDVTTHWPIPWGGILYRLDEPNALDAQPGYVRAAARRVRSEGYAQTETGRVHYNATLDLTNRPAVVRGFDASGRQDVQGEASAELTTQSTAIRLSLGAKDARKGDRQALVLDGSYIAQRVGNAAIYVGYLPHWWGPGWFSALSLSNNARPFPQVGVSRISTTPFKSSWLSWIGPWQAEFFVGWLDGPRVAKNTLYDGLRVTFNPLPGLEIGVARTDELCGEDHPCKPLATYFDFRNDPQHPSRTNDEGVIDVRYTTDLDDLPFEVYTQVMNEDSNPIYHSGTSHLFGASVWIPLRDSTARFTIEYTDSIATRDIFSFGNDFYAFTYNDYKYADGMRYRSDATGFSLDNDSRLTSIQVSLVDARRIAYTLTYHRASISSPNSIGANPITSTPVTINIGEARVSLPFQRLSLQVVGRAQDDQPRPDHGFAASIESIVSINL